MSRIWVSGLRIRHEGFECQVWGVEFRVSVSHRYGLVLRLLLLI